MKRVIASFSSEEESVIPSPTSLFVLCVVSVFAINYVGNCTNFISTSSSSSSPVVKGLPLLSRKVSSSLGGCCLLLNRVVPTYR